MKWTIAFFGIAALVSASSAPSAAKQYDEHRLRVVIAAKDQKRSFEFYGILGMKPGFKHTETLIELNWPDDMAGILVNSGPKPAGVPPTATFVMTVPDLTLTADQLRKAGFPDIGKPKGGILVIKDPDGNVIELSTASSKKPR